MRRLAVLPFFQDIKAELDLVEQELQRWVRAPEPVLAEAAAHLLQSGGKRLRPAFVLLTGRIYNDHPLEKLLPLAVALELIHMATLVHDDVIDASVTRRGVPTVKAKWGDEISLCAGGYLFARSMALIASYNNPRIAWVLAEVSTKMCQGEIQQMASAYDLNQSFRDYLYRVKCKTALLISASCKLGAVVTGAPEQAIRALAAYGYYLGMAFQITDDVLDITGNERELGKPVGSDLRQGIITLPVLYALSHSLEKERLALLVKKQAKSETEIQEALEAIRKSNALAFSFRVVNRYLVKAKKKLGCLPPGRPREILEQVADFIGQRRF